MRLFTFKLSLELRQKSVFLLGGYSEKVLSFAFCLITDLVGRNNSWFEESCKENGRNAQQSKLHPVPHLRPDTRLSASNNSSGIQIIPTLITHAVSHTQTLNTPWNHNFSILDKVLLNSKLTNTLINELKIVFYFMTTKAKCIFTDILVKKKLEFNTLNKGLLNI